MPLLDPHLASLLVCPLCHGALRADEVQSQLQCCTCGRTYPVRDFPIMMPELAESEENREATVAAEAE